MRLRSGWVLLAIAACGKPAPLPVPKDSSPSVVDTSTRTRTATKTATTTAVAPPPPEVGRGSGGHGGTGRGAGDDRLPPPTQGQRYRDPVVFHDGVPIAVVAFGDLPPKLETMWVEIVPKMKVRRFSLTDYLEALGLGLKKIKEVHFYGGKNRVSIISGDELRRTADVFRFSFTQSNGGKARLHYAEGIKTNDRVDLIVNVAVYEKKKPPVWSDDRFALELDGQALDDVPYVTQEVRGGTRVYVDGRLVGTLKRNKLPDPDTKGDPADPATARWKLAPLLVAPGLELKKIKTPVDLINEDALVARVPPKELAAMEVSVAGQKGGQLVIHPIEKPVTVFHFYSRSKPIDFEKR